jgi:aryl-alcohol dehydrogenase-like predicted oxidoreductase
MSGAFTRADRELPEPFLGEDTKTRLEVLNRVAREVKATPNQVVLAWLLRSDPKTIPLLGVSSPDQLEENLGALELSLSDEHLEELSQAHNWVQTTPPRRQRPKIRGMKEG